MKSHPAWLVIRSALLCGALATGLAAGNTAHAAPAAVDYVALGDSYSSGTGTNSYDLSSSCQRSSLAYPALYAARAGVSSFSFAACGGAKTADVTGSQLASLSGATDLVTISIGGNDSGFVDVMLSCRLGSDNDCYNRITTAKQYIANTLPGKLTATYQAIKNAAPSARLVVLGYPRLFETGSCGFGSISSERRTRINGVADDLAATISAAASAKGATFVDARQPFAGHGICAQDAWINGPAFPVTDSYHPRKSGHEKAYLPALTSAVG